MTAKRNNLFISIVNFITIACSISYKITIFPYMLFYPFQYSDLFPLVLVALEFTTIIINRRNGLNIRVDFIKFLPLKAYFGIMLLQLFIAFIYLRINSIGAAFLFFADGWLLCVLVYSLCVKRTQNGNIINAVPVEYLILASVNVALVCCAAILMLANIVNPMTNNVSNMCVLFQGNVETGQTYYMPNFISIQNSSTRLTSLGELTGWAFEPHLFCLLVIPALFYIMGRPIKRIKKYIIVSCFLLSAFFGFSVTGFIMLVIVGSVALLTGRGNSIINIILILSVIGCILVIFGDYLRNSLLIEYTRTKLVDNTASADYSIGNLEWSFSPKDILGQGIMRWDLKHNKNPDIGILSFILLLIYYLSSFHYTRKAILSSNKYVRFIGLGVLYVLLHSTKMANAVFYMPFISMQLVILYIAYNHKK